ncbi:MAG TPA: hypothetical protein VFD70_04695 [Anaerolineae bacterium]|nr:hypothetical protein [Anaerolineae bacterium]
MSKVLRYAVYGWLLTLLAFCTRHRRGCRCGQCQTETADRRASGKQLCELVGAYYTDLNDARFIAYAAQYDLDALPEQQRQAVEALAKRNPRLLDDLLQDIQA